MLGQEPSSKANQSKIKGKVKGKRKRYLYLAPTQEVGGPSSVRIDYAVFERAILDKLAELRPADIASDSLDLTQGALGLTLELVLTEKVAMTRAKPGKRSGEEGASARLLFTPTRPGQVLAEATRRRWHLARSYRWRARIFPTTRSPPPPTAQPT